MKQFFLLGLEDDTIAGSIAGGVPQSIDSEALAQQKLSVYHQYDFSQYSEAAHKLPIYDCKKEVRNNS